MATCTDGEPCRGPSDRKLGEMDYHGCREGQLKQAPGESSSNQSKRKCPESGSLQQGASKKRASSSKASRTRLSLGKKLEVIRLLDENVAFSDITSLYGCGVSTIRKIKRERRKLELDAASCARKASSKSSRGVGIPEVDKAVLALVEEDVRRGQLPVTRAKIHAFGIAARDKLLQAPSTLAVDRKKLAAFGASGKWVRNFRSRNGMTGRPATVKAAGAGTELEERDEIGRAHDQDPDGVSVEEAENSFEETSPSEEDVERDKAKDATSAGGGGADGQPSYAELPSSEDLASLFGPLEAYAESCGLHEARELLRKANMEFLAARAAKTARQLDIRSFLKP